MNWSDYSWHVLKYKGLMYWARVKIKVLKQMVEVLQTGALRV